MRRNIIKKKSKSKRLSAHKTFGSRMEWLKNEFSISGPWLQFTTLMIFYVVAVTTVFYKPADITGGVAKYPIELSFRLAGALMLVSAMVLVMILFMMKFERETLASPQKLGLFITFNVIALVTAKLFVMIAYWHQSSDFIIYLTPIALYAIMISLIFGTNLAIFTGIYSSVFLGVMYYNDFRLTAAMAAGAIVGVFATGNIRKRSQPLIAGVLAGAATMIVSFALALLGKGNAVITQKIIAESMWGLVSGVAAGFIITGFLPFIEYIFHVVTRISLLELTDQNQPALRTLILQAPGTYVHSLIVSNLSETAAEAIGANTLLAKVGSYFHDIGKLAKPGYFVENTGPKSRHEKLTPEMSTMIILSHVKDGVEIGEDFNIPAPIVDIIAQHHGTSRVEYFYQTALQQAKLANRGAVPEEAFRYPGPKPQSREAAIVMLADTIEATSRSLKDPTPARIRKMVHDLIMHRLLDGQLDESSLTLTDLNKIEEQFCFVLNSMYHSRIKYPKAGEEPLEDQSDEEIEEVDNVAREADLIED